VALWHAQERILEDDAVLVARGDARESISDDLIHAVSVLATFFERSVLADGAD
jgi:hypothetical protein